MGLPPLCLRYSLPGRSVTAAIHAGPSGPALEGLFPAYEERVDSSLRGGAALRVTEAHGEFRIVGEGGTVIATCEAGDLVPRYEHAVTEALLAMYSDTIQLHACGVVVGDRALLSVGPTGSGKSSLAFWWSEAGHPVLGDDIVFADDDGTAMPFKRLFKVDVEVLREARLNPADTPLFELGAGEVWYDPAAHGGWGGPAPVAAIAFLERRTGSPAVTPIVQSVALRTLMRSLMAHSPSGRAAFDPLVQLVRGTKVFSARFESAKVAAPLLLETLG